jgi:hypothetical protein
MTVDLFVDHLAKAPPASAEELWYDTKTQSVAYAAAAERIGLTPAEYREFRRHLLDGDAVRVLLPSHVDAMAGRRGSYVYAVRDARLATRVYGWQVALADGKTVYVPAACGNLSVVSAPVVAHHWHPAPVAYLPTYHRRAAPVAVAVTAAAAPNVVTFSTPPPVAPAYSPPEPLTAPAPANAANYTPVLGLGLPILGGIIYTVSHLGGNPVAPPPCSAGSNSEFACRK